MVELVSLGKLAGIDVLTDNFDQSLEMMSLRL